MALPTPVSPQVLAELCQRYGVRRLLLFGSFARGEADEESDVDLLVEFFPGRTPGLGFARLQEELTRLRAQGGPPYPGEPEPLPPGRGPKGGPPHT